MGGYGYGCNGQSSCVLPALAVSGGSHYRGQVVGFVVIVGVTV